MTEATAPARQPEAREFLEIWSDSFSRVLGQITGSAVPCTVQAETAPPADLSSAALPPPGEGDLCVVVTSSGALRGEMSVRLASATVLRLAQIFRSEPATPEAQLTADHAEADHAEADHGEAVVELLRQVSGLVSTAAKARWGEIQLLVEAAPAAPSWPSAGSFRLQTGAEDSAGIFLDVSLSAALVAGLRVEKAEAAKVDAAKASIDSSPVVAAAVPGQGRGALDMLMDVQLAMTLRFGTRRLLLREVLDLSPGAVVELDRGVHEPVDLLLDGKLVARGEVVVVDGNYGLRVTDMSPLGAG
ncbi:MAG: flagellar motor switch protein FliN [Candidatus Sulfotelmatobacter sp.]